MYLDNREIAIIAVKKWLAFPQKYNSVSVDI